MTPSRSDPRPARPGHPTYADELTARIKKLETELAQSGAGKGVRLPLPQHSKWEFVPASSDKGESWLLTYLDLLTLLLVLLVVMLSFAGNGDRPSDTSPIFPASAAGPGLLHGSITLHSDEVSLPFLPETPRVANGPAPRPHVLPAAPDKTVFDDLNLSGLDAGIDIIVEEQTIRFRIASEILFSSGQADLSRPGLAVLQNLLTVVKDTDYMIAVEGHTDSVPIHSTRYPSNWELSGARAGSVVRYLESNGIPSHRLRAIGYADTLALAGNDTAQGRASNRRVELIMELPQP